jgi:hypothetical protein
VEPLEAGAYALIVLGAALAPLVEVGMREASEERATVVVVCAAGFAGSAALAMYALARRRTGAERGLGLLVLLPLAAAATLWALWFIEYRTDGLVARASVLAALLAAIAACSRFAPRVDARRVLPALGVLVLGHAATGALYRPGPTLPPLPPSELRRSPSPSTRCARTGCSGDHPRGCRRRRPVRRRQRGADDARPRRDQAVARHDPDRLSPSVRHHNRRAAAGRSTRWPSSHAAGYRTGGLGLNAHLARLPLDQASTTPRSRRTNAWPAPAGAPRARGLPGALSFHRGDRRRGRTDDAHASDAPFFLWLHMLDPHWPYEPPAEWLEHPERSPRRWGEPDMVTDVQAGNTKPGAAERARVSELYAGEIRYVDHELERVLARLREMGLYERALIVLASDHGEEFWEHGRYEHGHTLYDEILRVPLAFAAGPIAGRAHRRAGLDRGADADRARPPGRALRAREPERARSLVPWWRAPADARPEPLFATGTYYFGEKRGGFEMKLVLELDTGRCELYDPPAIRADALARLGLARDPPQGAAAHPGLAGELRRAREVACAQVDAQAGGAALRAMRALGYSGTQ